MACRGCGRHGRVETVKETINIGILGLGVVGSGTVALLEQNRAMIEAKVGARLHIRRIAVRDLQKKRAVQVDRALYWTTPPSTSYAS